MPAERRRRRRRGRDVKQQLAVWSSVRAMRGGQRGSDGASEAVRTKAFLT